jgi:hypothetical protein
MLHAMAELDDKRLYELLPEHEQDVNQQQEAQQPHPQIREASAPEPALPPEQQAALTPAAAR